MCRPGVSYPLDQSLFDCLTLVVGELPPSTADMLAGAIGF